MVDLEGAGRGPGPVALVDGPDLVALVALVEGSPVALVDGWPGGGGGPDLVALVKGIPGPVHPAGTGTARNPERKGDPSSRSSQRRNY